MRYLETGLWADVRELPAALRATLETGEGVADAAELLRDPRVERVVATGNGAAYYVAQALWLASLESAGAGRRSSPSRAGSRYASSSAGARATPCSRCPRPAGSATWSRSRSGRPGARASRSRRAPTPRSPPRRARRWCSSVFSQRAVTHTQAVAGAYASGLALWAAVTGDEELAALVAASADAARGGGRGGRGLGRRSTALAVPPAAIAVGGGTAWAAAVELALMLKEISRIPAEGVETREGATSAMFGLDRGHLMVSLDAEGDALGDEAVRLCAAAGATTLRLPGVAGVDPRLTPITTLPAASALAAELALAAGHDVDRPTWTEAYYETARSAT